MGGPGPHGPAEGLPACAAVGPGGLAGGGGRRHPGGARRRPRGAAAAARRRRPDGAPVAGRAGGAGQRAGRWRGCCVAGHRVGTRLRRVRADHRQLVDIVAQHDRSGCGSCSTPPPPPTASPAGSPGWCSRRACSTRCPRDQLEAVVAHEEAHLRGRHDLLLEFFSVVHSSVPEPLRSPAALGEVRLLVEALADRAAVRRSGEVATARALMTLAGSDAPEAALGAGTTAPVRLRLLADGPPHPALSVLAYSLRRRHRGPAPRAARAGLGVSDDAAPAPGWRARSPPRCAPATGWRCRALRSALSAVANARGRAGRHDAARRRRRGGGGRCGCRGRPAPRADASDVRAVVEAEVAEHDRSAAHLAEVGRPDDASQGRRRGRRAAGPPRLRLGPARRWGWRCRARRGGRRRRRRGRGRRGARRWWRRGAGAAVGASAAARRGGGGGPRACRGRARR